MATHIDQHGMVRPVRTLCLIMILVCAMGLSSSIVHAAVDISFVTYLSGLGTPKTWGDLIQAFMDANPDISVSVQTHSVSEYIDKAFVMMLGGAPPDVLQTWAQYKPQWVQQGLLMDLTSRWDHSTTIAKSRVYPFMLESAKYGGRIYGVPYDYNAEVWFYNLDTMAKRGVAVPDENWDVDDLRKLAAKLSDPSSNVYGAANNLISERGGNIQWMRNWTGHEWLSDDKKAVLVDESPVKSMMSWWRDLQDSGHAFPRAKPVTYAMEQAYLSGAFGLARTATYKFGYNVMPKAAAGQTSFAQGHMFSIPKGAKHPDAAWCLLEWLVSYEGQKAVIATTLRQPIGPYPDLWSVFFNQAGAEYGPAMYKWVLHVLYGQSYVSNFTYWPTYPEMAAVMTESMTNIYEKGMPVPGEMDNAAKRMRALLQ
jgi:ABC-type glycerol-3-phosphate transport system substrate-binding protein